MDSNTSITFLKSLAERYRKDARLTSEDRTYWSCIVNAESVDKIINHIETINSDNVKLRSDVGRLSAAINKAADAMHVNCDTGFLCLSDFDFGELKKSLNGDK